MSGSENDTTTAGAVEQVELAQDIANRLHPVTGQDKRCEHGVRWPHPCDDCELRDIPLGKSITDHPCHGISMTPGKLSHRAYITKDEPIYCERCGTELDENKKQKPEAPLCWEPRTMTKPPEPVVTGELKVTPEEIENLRYVAAMLDTHGDKFPVPSHVPMKADHLRKLADKLAHALPGDVGRLERALRDVNDRVAAYGSEALGRTINDIVNTALTPSPCPEDAFANTAPWAEQVNRPGDVRMREALERISKLTPFSANAATAEDFAATVHAITDSTLAALPSHQGTDE